MVETPDSTVKVSKELLAELDEWSPPIHIKITKSADGEHEVIARTHECDEQPDQKRNVLSLADESLTCADCYDNLHDELDQRDTCDQHAVEAGESVG